VICQKLPIVAVIINAVVTCKARSQDLVCAFDILTSCSDFHQLHGNSNKKNEKKREIENESRENIKERDEGCLMVLQENWFEEIYVNHRNHQSNNSKIYGYLHFEIGPTHIFKMQYLLFLLIHCCWLSSLSVTDPFDKLQTTFCRTKSYNRVLCTLHVVEYKL
jgi:hypothetical protein